VRQVDIKTAGDGWMLWRWLLMQHSMNRVRRSCSVRSSRLIWDLAGSAQGAWCGAWDTEAGARSPHPQLPGVPLSQRGIEAGFQVDSPEGVQSGFGVSCFSRLGRLRFRGHDGAWPPEECHKRCPPEADRGVGGVPQFLLLPPRLGDRWLTHDIDAAVGFVATTERGPPRTPPEACPLRGVQRGEAPLRFFSPQDWGSGG
jgi:hypothetical protein